MGILSFMKNVGTKIFRPDQAKEEKEAALSEYLMKFNLRSAGVTSSVNDGVVTLTGTVDSELEKQRIIATVGNIDDVESVDDQIVVDAGEVVSGSVRMYEVKSGDTLSKISEEMYGDASLYGMIFEANKPMLDDVDKIYPGQRLVIPAKG